MTSKYIAFASSKGITDLCEAFQHFEFTVTHHLLVLCILYGASCTGVGELFCILGIGIGISSPAMLTSRPFIAFTRSNMAEASQSRLCGMRGVGRNAI